MRSQIVVSLTRACGRRYASNHALEEIERELVSSIKSQKERIEKIDTAFKAQAAAGPWRLAAIASAGFACVCAFRLVMDKRDFEVRAVSVQFCMRAAGHIVIGLMCAGKPNSLAGRSERTTRYNHKVSSMLILFLVEFGVNRWRGSSQV